MSNTGKNRQTPTDILGKVARGGAEAERALRMKGPAMTPEERSALNTIDASRTGGDE